MGESTNPRRKPNEYIQVGKKPGTDAVAVVLMKSDTEFDQYQALTRAAVMIGGVLGEAVLDTLASYQVDVLRRAVTA